MIRVQQMYMENRLNELGVCFGVSHERLVEIRFIFNQVLVEIDFLHNFFAAHVTRF